MKIIGVTGGVGSGKTSVMKYVQENFNVPVILADQVGSRLMEPGEAVYKKLLEAYGSDIIRPDETIDRTRLAQIGFASGEATERLNRLTHPLIRKEIEKEIKQAEESGEYEYLLYEAALPEEADMRQICEEIWYIHVPQNIRIARLRESRGYTEEKCRAIIEKQIREEDFLKIADHVIENGGDFAITQKQIDRLL